MSPLLVVVLLVTANIAVARQSSAVVNVSSMEVCTKYGQMCDASCKQIGICIDSGYGFEFKKTVTCGKDLYCDNGSHRCVQKEQSTCVPNKEEIMCGDTGTFPYLYDCTYPMKCDRIGKAGILVTQCGKGMKFDPCTSQCYVANLDQFACTKVEPLCEYAGQVQRVSGNDRLFYYCAEDDNHLLRPVIKRCAEGFFKLNTGSCSNSTVPGCVDPDPDNEEN